MSVKDSLAQSAHSIFPEYMAKYDAIEIISLSTADGFPVYSSRSNEKDFDEDKMSAASSTLYSVSNAVARQILQKQFKITYIEAEQGNMGFVSISLQEQDFVLAMSANETMNVGQLRLFINRVASDLISSIPK